MLRKACDNNTQTIPNNMVLLAKIGNMLFSSRRGWRPSISNRVLHVPRMDVETEPIHFTPLNPRDHLFSDPSPYGAQLGP